MECMPSNLRLAELLFPHIDKTPEYYETKYPPRNLPEGAIVTRIAPSPTGYIHFGNLYGALIDERLAHQTGGVFYLRIENTDQKREVEGAVEQILDGLNKFGLRFDEGATETKDKGAYGPYRQRDRAELYQTIAKDMVKRGLAYPCFCTEEELEDIRKAQEKEGANFGYYGKWAKHAQDTPEQIETALREGKSFVLRLRSPGREDGKVRCRDLVKGDMELPENFNDIVLLKSDGIPTYHFAHVIDDHFMRTTHVVRGEEWLSTFHYHLQLFDLLGWQRPVYIHTPHMLKQEGASKRKLSKRKDPEARLSFYLSEGYPAEGVVEYLLTVLNSDFEDWRKKNPDLSCSDFRFRPERMGTAGAVFDIDKLRDISRTLLSRMSAEEVYRGTAAWAKEYAPEFYTLLTRDPAYSQKILSIGRGGPKPRKDLTVWSDVPEYVDFFFEETFDPVYLFPDHLEQEDIRAILDRYVQRYTPDDDQQIWFSKIRELTAELGFAADMKAYKADPAAYRGNVSDVSMVLRVAVTGKTASPDTFAVMQILGKDRVLQRLNRAKEVL